MKKPIILDAGLAECIRHIGLNMTVGQHYEYGKMYPYEKLQRLSTIYYEVEGEGGKIQDMTAPIFKSFFKIVDNSIKKGTV